MSTLLRSVLRSAYAVMWEPFWQNLERWAAKCQIIYDKFHILPACRQYDG